MTETDPIIEGEGTEIATEEETSGFFERNKNALITGASSAATAAVLAFPTGYITGANSQRVQDQIADAAAAAEWDGRSLSTADNSARMLMKACEAGGNGQLQVENFTASITKSDGTTEDVDCGVWVGYPKENSFTIVAFDGTGYEMLGHGTYENGFFKPQAAYPYGSGPQVTPGALTPVGPSTETAQVSPGDLANIGVIMGAAFEKSFTAVDFNLTEKPISAIE